MTNGVFSDYELDELGFKFKDETAYQSAKCIGSAEEEMEVKVITKSCRGVVAKEIVKPTGRGTVKITAHVPRAIYLAMFGMELDSLIEGVKGYGRNSVHKNFSMVAHVTDEDGAEKLVAYPNCVVKTGKTSKIENGAEEVAQIELEVSVSPDEFGQGMYEALVEDLTDDTVANTWMTAFTPALTQKVPQA
jgi:hypothetical protein